MDARLELNVKLRVRKDNSQKRVQILQIISLKRHHIIFKVRGTDTDKNPERRIDILFGPAEERGEEESGPKEEQVPEVQHALDPGVQLSRA